jgi:hypothetical protein
MVAGAAAMHGICLSQHLISNFAMRTQHSEAKSGDTWSFHVAFLLISEAGDFPMFPHPAL